MTIKNITVSSEVKKSLPGVLIDYLCKLAASDEYSGQPVQTFILTPRMLGGKRIQDILHINKIRHVFGFEPVDCELRVLPCTDHYEMVLAN